MAERPEKCIGCNFFEDDYVNDDGDRVEGWGCCNPGVCISDIVDKEKKTE